MREGLLVLPSLLSVWRRNSTQDEDSPREMSPFSQWVTEMGEMVIGYAQFSHITHFWAWIWEMERHDMRRDYGLSLFHCPIHPKRQSYKLVGGVSRVSTVLLQYRTMPLHTCRLIAVIMCAFLNCFLIGTLSISHALYSSSSCLASLQIPLSLAPSNSSSVTRCEHLVEQPSQ